MTSQDYLKQLQTDKANLVANLVEKGVEATDNETFTSLVPKVLDIESGGGEIYAPNWLSFYYFPGLPEELYKNFENIDISNITSAKYMFMKACYNNNLPNRSTFVVPRIFNNNNITDMTSMFEDIGYNYKYITLDVSNLYTGKATTMTSMMSMRTGSNNLEQIVGFDSFDTSNVTDFKSMFYSTDKVAELDLSSFDTSKATTFERMFEGCSGLTNIIGLNNFNTENVTTLYLMFSNCSKLENLDLSSFDTSNVTTMYGMTSNCSSLTTLNLGETFYCDNIKDIRNAIGYSINLTTILGSFKKLGKGYTQKSNNYSSYKVTLDMPNLTHDSVMNIINGLYDLNLTYDVANGGTLYTQSLTLGATNMAKLTEEEIAIATNKGWTVS